MPCASQETPRPGRGRVTMTATLDRRSAVLDSQHVGDIRGALGTIRLDDTSPRRGRSAHLKTLLAIVGPGLIVMVGDNDAGAFATYGQAGQNYGTRLLWTLLLLVPVLYVNQEMVLRLGAVTGVGHARLILERFGKFWGAFSVIDLFILNALTIITEFIGITLAAGYLGLPKIAAVGLAAMVVVGAAFTGSFRRFERTAVAFCAGSLLLIPVYFLAHPHVTQMARGFVVPQLPGGSGQLSTVMLLVIGIVGTTAAFAGSRGFGHFTDAAGLASGLQAYAGRTAGVLFAIALLDASIIGAFAVSLSTAYAISDVFGLKHSLHRGVKGAKGFYAIYAGLIGIAATIVLLPGSPVGLLTEGVQVLAGVLLPSASVFLLLLCNDSEVLGPWMNGRKTNMFTAAVVAVLVSLSVILKIARLALGHRRRPPGGGFPVGAPARRLRDPRRGRLPEPVRTRAGGSCPSRSGPAPRAVARARQDPRRGQSPEPIRTRAAAAGSSRSGPAPWPPGRRRGGGRCRRRRDAACR